MANGDEMVTVEQLKLFEDTKLSSSLKLVSGYAIGTYSGIPIQNLVMAKDPEDVGAGTVQMGIDGDHGNVQIIRPGRRILAARYLSLYERANRRRYSPSQRNELGHTHQQGIRH